MGGTWQAKAGVGPMKGGGCHNNISVGSESTPHFNIGPCGRGFELSRRRKKRAIGTCPYSPVSEWSPLVGRPRGGALTIKGAFLLWHPPPFMGPTPALACQVPPIHEVLGPTHLDIPLLTGFLP